MNACAPFGCHGYGILSELVGRALDAADLPQKVRKRHRVIIKWFLGHLKGERKGATVVAAREFVDSLTETRKAQEWSRKRLRLTRSLLLD